MGIDYYTSERFIHDDLCAQVTSGVYALYDVWRTCKRVDPFAILWPANPIKSREGVQIDSYITLRMEADPATWMSDLLAAIKKVEAYGLAFVRQSEEAVLVTFESQHGAKHWALPIIRSGDVRILKEPVTSVDEQRLGLLWHEDRPSA